MSKATFVCEMTASPKFGRRELWIVPISEIEPWEFNPSVRTEGHALNDLDERFGKETGQLVPGAAVFYHKGNNIVAYRLIDAHRRYELCKRDGITSMELVIYRDVAPATQKFGVLFDTLNGGSRKVNARERTGLALDGQHGAAGDVGVRNAELAEKVLDGIAMEKFRDNNQPNHTLTLVHQFAKEAQSKALIPNGFPALRRFTSDAFVWAVSNNQARNLLQYRTFYNQFIAQNKIASADRARKRLVGWILANQTIPPVAEWAKNRRSAVEDLAEASA